MGPKGRLGTAGRGRIAGRRVELTFPAAGATWQSTFDITPQGTYSVVSTTEDAGTFQAIIDGSWETVSPGAERRPAVRDLPVPRWRERHDDRAPRHDGVEAPLISAAGSRRCKFPFHDIDSRTFRRRFPRRGRRAVRCRHRVGEPHRGRSHGRAEPGDRRPAGHARAACSSACSPTATCCSRACRAWPRRSPCGRSRRPSTPASSASSSRPTCCRPTSSARMIYNPRSGEFTSQKGPDLRQPRARRRDQPRAGQGAERAARGDAGAAGHDRRRDATRCPSRSSCWRRRTRSSRRAPTRCPRRRSTASCCKLRVGYPDARGGERDPRSHGAATRARRRAG